MSDLHHVVTGSGPPILLIHGTGADGDSWQPIADALAASYRVITYDRRGFGRSPGPAPTGKEGWARHAADAGALLDAVAPDAPAYVVGWSGGGIVALHLALTHPERVRALTLVEPPLWAKRRFSPRMAVSMVRAMWNGARKRPRDGAAIFFRAVTRFRDGGGCGFDALPEPRRSAMLARSDSVLAEVRAGTGEELTPARLATLRAPTTLLLGTRSQPMFAAAARDLGRVLPSLRTAAIEGAGHIPMHEAPAALAAAIGVADPATAH